MRIKNEKGAAAVEFAVVLPLLLLLIFGMIEFGLLIYNKAMITNAGREAARAGVVYATNPSDGSLARLSTAELTQIVNDYCEQYLITFGNSAGPQTTVTTNNGGAPQSMPSGDLLTVTVTFHYDFLLVPAFISSLVGGSTLEAVTTMRAE
jgi:Flp pilus assembly protein TadG